MSNYINSLSKKQKDNILTIIQVCINNGITNPKLIASILSVVSKESGFNPKNEDSYKGTANKDIRRIFGAWRTDKFSEADLTKLKQSDFDFFEAMYGIQNNKRLGLGQEKYGDGYLFRGRGFNGLTGRGNYKRYSKIIGVDIESDPELVNKLDVALKILIAYFKNRIKANKLDINNLGTDKNTLDSIYRFNAGISLNKPITDTTGGYKKAVERYPDFLKLVNQNISNIPTQTLEPEKKNDFMKNFEGFIWLLIGFFVYKKLKKKN